MSRKPARYLTVGDVFSLHLYAEVIAIMPAAADARVKVWVAVEDQGHRSYRKGTFSEGPSTLEFLDDHVLEFLCRPGRKFHVYDDDTGDGWDGDDANTPTPLTPAIAE
jgi:hypothetical protein